LSINVVLALGDDRIADFADENNKARRRIVMVRVLPDKQNSVHHRHKEFGNLRELKRGRNQVNEEIIKCFEVLVVLIGFLLSDLHFLLEFREGSGVGRLVLLEELKHFLNALGVKLLADLVQVFTLALPEFKLGQRARVLVVFKGIFGVLLEHILDLLLPVDD
jgi:hypothetical protein